MAKPKGEKTSVLAMFFVLMFCLDVASRVDLLNILAFGLKVDCDSERSQEFICESVGFLNQNTVMQLLASIIWLKWPKTPKIVEK